MGMLILTRRVGEAITIGEDIKLTVLGVKGNQVRIGVSAPKNVSVHREEIYKKIVSDIVNQKFNVTGTTLSEQMVHAREAHKDFLESSRSDRDEFFNSLSESDAKQEAIKLMSALEQHMASEGVYDD